MKDSSKTKSQLLKEIKKLQQQIKILKESKETAETYLNITEG